MWFSHKTLIWGQKGATSHGLPRSGGSDRRLILWDLAEWKVLSSDNVSIGKPKSTAVPIEVIHLAIVE
jgi:hypothetical protein